MFLASDVSNDLADTLKFISNSRKTPERKIQFYAPEFSVLKIRKIGRAANESEIGVDTESKFSQTAPLQAAAP